LVFYFGRYQISGSSKLRAKVEQPIKSFFFDWEATFILKYTTIFDIMFYPYEENYRHSYITVLLGICYYRNGFGSSLRWENYFRFAQSSKPWSKVLLQQKEHRKLLQKRNKTKKNKRRAAKGTFIND
jgi:hypothetical protein